jgi:DegV family protein with EDD domain
VLLVTDSSACLPPGLLDRASLQVLPIEIFIGDEVLSDGPEAVPRVYRAFAEDEPTKSAPPSMLDYLDSMECSEFDAAVVLTPAVEVTVMYRNARLASAMARLHVEVVDTRTAAAGQGLIVQAAAEAQASGASAAEIAETARDAAQRTKLVAMLPDLTSIQRSGHVPANSLERYADQTSELLFRVEQGVISPLGRPNPQWDSPSVLQAAWLASGGVTAERTLFFHANAAAEASQFRSFFGSEEPIVEFSPAMAVHTGVGCVGVAWTSR